VCWRREGCPPRGLGNLADDPDELEVAVAEGRVLAIDLGTSSARALVFDQAGRAVPEVLARRPSPLRVEDDGTAELDPDRVVDAVGACLDELAAQGNLDAVETVAVSSAWHTVLAVDRGGRPLSAALTWADTRAAGLVGELAGRTDPARLHAETGAPLHATFWTVKVPWLARQLGGAPARYLGVADYLAARLLGDGGASLSMASGTGLLDLATAGWNQAALDLAGVGPAALPTLHQPGWTGRLTPAPARRWPALATARWYPAWGDGAASNVGAGCVTPAFANVNVGTSAAVRTVHDAPGAPLPRTLWRYRVDRDRVVTGAAFSGGGNLWTWASKVLALPGREAVDAALATVPPGSAGVTVLPYHAGARAPMQVPAGSGAVLGLSLATTAVEIVAASLEAVCFGLADGLEDLETTLPGTPTVVASGGGITASRWWQRTLANVIGRPVQVTDEPEASARGAALLALGAASDPATTHAVEPDPAAVAAERAARATFHDLETRLGYRSDRPDA
jgi:gluconokinase